MQRQQDEHGKRKLRVDGFGGDSQSADFTQGWQQGKTPYGQRTTRRHGHQDFPKAALLESPQGNLREPLSTQQPALVERDHGCERVERPIMTALRDTGSPRDVVVSLADSAELADLDTED